MTDCLLFASFFATYAVLFMNTAGGVSGKDIFELNFVAVETAALLLSSITFGFAMICAHRQNKSGALAWLAVTWALGACFIGMEVYEFHHLIEHGNERAAAKCVSNGVFLVSGTARTARYSGPYLDDNHVY